VSRAYASLVRQGTNPINGTGGGWRNLLASRNRGLGQKILNRNLCPSFRVSYRNVYLPSVMGGLRALAALERRGGRRIGRPNMYNFVFLKRSL
jgi:hypothetical protein